MINLDTCPILSRKDSFILTLNELNKNFINPNIIEIGCIRETNDVGAGNSSEIFAWYVTNYGGKFTTCDISKSNIDLCSMILKLKKYNNFKCVNKGGIEFLTEYCSIKNNLIDLLYLDGMDADDKIYAESAKFHLDCFKLCEKNINDNGLILIDDNFNKITFQGKGYYLIPYLLENPEYECIYLNYQVLFRKKALC